MVVTKFISKGRKPTFRNFVAAEYTADLEERWRKDVSSDEQ